jgi:hypothetical protein
MVTLHAFLALLAGFATMAIALLLATALLARLTPSWVKAQGRPSPGYVVVNLGYSFLQPRPAVTSLRLSPLRIRSITC